MHWKNWCKSRNSNTLDTCCEEPTHWKRPWCWERLKAGEGSTEIEMAGWHHRLNGHEFEQTPGDSEGQESLVCCNPQVTNCCTWLSYWITTAMIFLKKTAESGKPSQNNCIFTFTNCTICKHTLSLLSSLIQPSLPTILLFSDFSISLRKIPLWICQPRGFSDVDPTPAQVGSVADFHSPGHLLVSGMDTQPTSSTERQHWGCGFSY